MREFATITVLVGLLGGCAAAYGSDTAQLQVPAKWQPSHAQNGTSVTAIVRVFGLVEKPYPDPKTKSPVFQSKGRILRPDPTSGELVSSGLWAYLLSSSPLGKDSIFRVTGSLSVSESQVKGGAYPATIRVSGSKRIRSNKSSEPTP